MLARYDGIADLYVSEVGDAVTDPATAALLDLTGSLSGHTVLDLACGHGRISRELARRGASVTGVDASAALIERARQAEQLGVRYLVGDVTATIDLPSHSFDDAICNFGLSDIDDLAGALDTVATLLRPGGAFVFSLLHPCFPGWGPTVSSAWPPGAGYFVEGWFRAEAAASRLRRQVGANHRTLATYLNELAAHGLAIDRVVEPMPPSTWLTDNPDIDPVPTFLAARCVARPDR